MRASVRTPYKSADASFSPHVAVPPAGARPADVPVRPGAWRRADPRRPAGARVRCVRGRGAGRRHPRAQRPDRLRRLGPRRSPTGGIVSWRFRPAPTRSSSKRPAFAPRSIDALNVDVGRTLVRDFHLASATSAETVLVAAEVPLVDRATATVGHVVTARTIAADSAQRPPLHRSRSARAGIGGAVAERVLVEADSRRRRARVQYGRES